jgi:hypothetical protein
MVASVLDSVGADKEKQGYKLEAEKRAAEGGYSGEI